jgi:hypothetical protein
VVHHLLVTGIAPRAMDLMAEMQDVSAMLMGYSLQKKSTARRSARILVQLRQAAAQNLLLKIMKNLLLKIMNLQKCVAAVWRVFSTARHKPETREVLTKSPPQNAPW